MAIVKLKLRESKQGWMVDLTAKQLDVETEGFLPALPPQLELSFNDWQLAYREIDAVRSVFTSRQLRITPKSVTKYSSAEHTTSVKEGLNQWLNCGDRRWLPVRDKLIAIAQQLHQKNEEIRIIIDAKDVNLRRLPWQEWNLFEEHYPQVEIALSAAKSTYKKTDYLFPKSSKTRILVAVGRSDGINTKDDLEVIQELEQHGAEVVCLMQPTPKELCSALWDEQGYHIFIFTGHSGSREDGDIGWIELNDNDSLSIEQFKEALKQAINLGLQLAIFNSCDGLGLANQLAQLHLPRCIVMREPVPDKVAVEFLKNFFQEFTGDRSLSTALNKARKRLEHYNLEYPGAIWLPTICVASNVEPLTWESLSTGNSSYLKADESDSKSKPNNLIKPLILISFLVIGGIAAWKLFSDSPQKQALIETVSSKLPHDSKLSPEHISGTFRYGGSTSWAPIQDKVENAFEILYPNFKLKYIKPSQDNYGSTTGIKMLLNDELDYALSSRNLTPEERKIAEKKGFVLGEIPVAIDAIAVVVNHRLNVDELTLTQLEGIYTGKILNWKDLGGSNLPIIPYSRSEAGGTVGYFIEDVLRGKEFGDNLKFVPTTTKGVSEVAANDGGIYYASASEVVNQCSVKSLKLGKTESNIVAPYQQPLIPPYDCSNTNRNKVNIDRFSNREYPITRWLYVIYKEVSVNQEEFDLHHDFKSKEKTKRAAEAAQAYANWLKTNQGKQLLEKAGFASNF